MPPVADIDTDPAARLAKTCLARASRMEAICRGIDVATAITGLWLLFACTHGYPVLGLVPFGICLVGTAVATRKKERYRSQATLATLQVHNDHPHLDSGCDCR